MLTTAALAAPRAGGHVRQGSTESFQGRNTGSADDKQEGGGRNEERQGAGGGEGRRHADALDQSTENDEEPGEGEQSEEEAPKHLDRRVRSLETVGEHGQDGGVERKRRQQAGEPRAEWLCQAREPQHEGGRHRHSRRNVPARERRSPTGLSPSRHQTERQGERQAHGREQPDEREGDVLERKGRRAEREAARPEGHRPLSARGEPPVGEDEGGLGEGSGERTDGRGACERGAVVEREKEDDGAGREREPDEPATHPPPPAATGDAGRSDEGRRQNELEDQTVQGGLTADGLHDVLVRKDVLWPSAEDELTAVDRVEAGGGGRRVLHGGRGRQAGGVEPRGSPLRRADAGEGAGRPDLPTRPRGHAARAR